MKRLFFIAVIALMAFPCRLAAQEYPFQKISTDLQEAWSQDADNTMHRVVILMREQFDAKKMTKQTQHLSKAQKREFVVKELQRISQSGQKELLKELQQGQKGGLIEDVRSFWIFNGICCSATKDMVFAIAERPEVSFVMKEPYICIPEGETIQEMVEEDNEIQWNVNKVNAPAVWDWGYTGAGVIVAVIDSGVNYNHTDIKNNMWDGGEDFPHHGWDFINNDNDPMDDGGHGTHCAGIVSSYGANGKQCGIAKDAKIMALKALSSTGGSPLSAAWASIEFAISHGADILSMSFGSSGMGGYWVDRAIMENVLHCGVVASVAAGNDGNKSNYPAPYNVNSPGNCPSPWQHPDQTLGGGHTATITVGSVNNNDRRASSSSYGPSSWTIGDFIGNYNDYPWVAGDSQNIGLIKPDIAAPGVNITSLDYSGNNGYTFMSGTSMATPCVAGVMALMLQANPTLSPLEIDSIIETTADACGGQTTKNNYYGSGRINALSAISYMLGACAAPTDLNASVTGFDVTLQWNSAENVDTYRIYRNNVMIVSSVAGTTYIDENAPAGDNTYYVRSNGNNGQASLPSNEITVTVAASHTPFHLMVKEIDTTERTVDLQWNLLYYCNRTSTYYDVGETHIAAQTYPTSILQSYAGMQIEHVYFIGAHAGKDFIIRLYEGDVMMPGDLVFSSDSITTTEDNQLVDYELVAPVQINPNKPLWLTIETNDMLMIGKYPYTGNGDAFLLGFPDDASWISQHGFAWTFQMSLGESDGFKHKLYRNGTPIASDIDVSQYTAEYIQGINSFQVTAYKDEYESRLSNSIILVDGNGSINDLILEEDDQLYALEGSRLTVNNTLINVNPDHLVLEDDAQLVNDSEGVQATVKKNIQPYTEGKRDGWNLIASPVIESITPSRSNGMLTNTYDLYLFDQSEEKEWRNYRANSFTTIDHKTGYLYANSAETTLSFVGTLVSTAEPTELILDDEAYFAGFNLIGNPYPCNTYIERPFYVLEYNSDSDSTKFVLGDNDTPIASCAAVLVQAQGHGDNVTFSKTALSTTSKIAVNLSQAGQKGTTVIDQVRITFQQQCQLDKYPQRSSSSTIYIPQNNRKLAVASAEGLTELPINLSIAQNGTYTLSTETEKLDLNYLHLIDNMTGDDVDLLSMPSYTFDANVDDHDWRFRLVFASNCEDAVGDNETFAYVSNGEIVICADACDASLQIVDMTGRVIVSRGGHIQCVPTTGMAQGVYVLRLINGNDLKTQKIVIE